MTKITKKYLFFMLSTLVGSVAIAQDKNTDRDNSPLACQNKWGNDSVETAKQLSLFNQYYQEKKYLEAFPYWKYLFDNAPCIQKRVTYAGPYIVKKKIKDIHSARKPIFAAEKAKLKMMKANTEPGSVDAYKAYKDTVKQNIAAHKKNLEEYAELVFDCYKKRIEFHGREGYVKGKWANEIVKLTPSNRAEGLAMFEESIGLEGNATAYKVPKDFIYAGVKEYKAKKLSMDSLFRILDIVTPIIDNNIAKYTAAGLSVKDSSKGVKWVETQDAVIGMLKPYLNCDKLKELKEPYFDDNIQNTAWLKATINLLDRGGCQSEEFYLQVSEALFALEPSSDAALSLAKAFNKQGIPTKAINYYTKAADLADTDEAKFDIWIKLAKTSKNKKEYPKVREYARKALAINPNSGESYILIGDAYAASASSCGTGDLGRGGVYLAAVDKYAKAKSVDPSSAEVAQAKINKYAAYFPDKEDAFFKGINAGAAYKVGCWIGESTTVRFGS